MFFELHKVPPDQFYQENVKNVFHLAALQYIQIFYLLEEVNSESSCSYTFILFL